MGKTSVIQQEMCVKAVLLARKQRVKWYEVGKQADGLVWQDDRTKRWRPDASGRPGLMRDECCPCVAHMRAECRSNVSRIQAGCRLMLLRSTPVRACSNPDPPRKEHCHPPAITHQPPIHARKKGKVGYCGGNERSFAGIELQSASYTSKQPSKWRKVGTSNTIDRYSPPKKAHPSSTKV